MDRLEKYRNAIKKVLTEYHEWVSGSANLDQESCLVFDEIHDQYFWLFMGWEGKKKIRNIQVHIRIKLKMRRFILRRIGLRKVSLRNY